MQNVVGITPSFPSRIVATSVQIEHACRLRPPAVDGVRTQGSCSRCSRLASNVA